MKINVTYEPEDIELLRNCLNNSTCIGYADDSIKTTAFKQALNLLQNCKELRKTVEEKKKELSQMEENLTRLEQKLTEAGLIDVLTDETIAQMPYNSDVSKEDEKQQDKKYYIEKFFDTWEKIWDVVIKKREKGELPQNVSLLAQVINYFNQHANADEIVGFYLMKYKEAYNHYRQDLSEVSENRSLREAEKKAERILKGLC